MKHSFLCTLLLFVSLFSPKVLANDWWFDVEVLLYKQDQSVQDLQEVFAQSANVDVSDATDLLTPFLRPDITALKDSLPLCDGPEPGSQRVPVVDITDPALKPVLEHIARLQETARQSASTQQQTGADEGAQVIGRVTPMLETHRQAQQQRFNLNHWLRGDCVYSQERRWLADLLFAHPEPEPMLNAVPAVIDDIERRFNHHPYLLPAQQMSLKDIARDLHRQRGIRPLLHVVWRQPVLFGRRNAEKYRLFGGRNFAQHYAVNGYPLQPLDEQKDDKILLSGMTQPPLMQRVEHALKRPLMLDEPEVNNTSDNIRSNALWELDGWFKVYLQYINRVPYLHIDSELVYRTEGPPGLMLSDSVLSAAEQQSGDNLSAQPMDDERLYTLPFNQLRRVISTQIHYFDHPMFGMVVQLRRYYKPQVPEQEQQAQ